MELSCDDKNGDFVVFTSNVASLVVGIGLLGSPECKFVRLLDSVVCRIIDAAAVVSFRSCDETGVICCVALFCISMIDVVCRAMGVICTVDSENDVSFVKTKDVSLSEIFPVKFIWLLLVVGCGVDSGNVPFGTTVVLLSEIFPAKTTEVVLSIV